MNRYYNVFQIEFYRQLYMHLLVWDKILSPSNGDSCKFPGRPDCILSELQMANPSLLTNIRSVSECLSYPTVGKPRFPPYDPFLFRMSSFADLDSNTADYPILHIITIPEFQSRPSVCFHHRLGSGSAIY